MTLTDLTLVTRDEASAALVPVPSTDAACCAPLTRETISAADAEVFSRRLKALADPVRLRLVSIVAASEGQEACVCDLIEPVGAATVWILRRYLPLPDRGSTRIQAPDSEQISRRRARCSKKQGV